MLLVQEVIAIGIVDLKIADADLELVRGHLSHPREDVRQSPGDDAAIGVPFSAARDRESLS